MKKLYIDKDVNILMGEQAQTALQKENDVAYVSGEEGVIRVPRARWEIAQHAEKTHWLVKGIKSIEDRNDYHIEMFDDYNALKGQHFSHAIELGCGPFTNLRHIATKCSIDACTLLDPLVLEYLNHHNCTYDRNELILAQHLSKKSVINMVIGKYVTGLYNYLRKQLNPALPVFELIPAPVEQMPTDRLYDMVCIINVLEHCYDITMVFDKILKIMKKGSVIIFHDRYYDHDEVKELVASQYDAAHPLKVDRKVVDAFLSDNFDVMYKKVTSNSSVLEGLDEPVVYEEVYFIGRRII